MMTREEELAYELPEHIDLKNVKWFRDPFFAVKKNENDCITFNIHSEAYKKLQKIAEKYNERLDVTMNRIIENAVV